MDQPFSAISDDPTIFEIFNKLGILIQFTSKVNIISIFIWEDDKITWLQHKKKEKKFNRNSTPPLFIFFYYSFVISKFISGAINCIQLVTPEIQIFKNMLNIACRDDRDRREEKVGCPEYS